MGPQVPYLCSRAIHIRSFDTYTLHFLSTTNCQEIDENACLVSCRPRQWQFHYVIRGLGWDQMIREVIKVLNLVSKFQKALDLKNSLVRSLVVAL